MNLLARFYFCCVTAKLQNDEFRVNRPMEAVTCTEVDESEVNSPTGEGEVLQED